MVSQDPKSFSMQATNQQAISRQNALRILENKLMSMLLFQKDR